MCANLFLPRKVASRILKNKYKKIYILDEIWQFKTGKEKWHNLKGLKVWQLSFGAMQMGK